MTWWSNFKKKILKNKGWAEDLYAQSKAWGIKPHEIIYADCPSPRLGRMIDILIFQIGFKADTDLQATINGINPPKK